VSLATAAVRQADWKHKALIRSILAVAAVLAGLGLGWPWVKDDLPHFGAVAGELAASRVSWFVIGMFCVAAVLFRRPNSTTPRAHPKSSRS
jgi:hypothetical protein